MNHAHGRRGIEDEDDVIGLSLKSEDRVSQGDGEDRDGKTLDDEGKEMLETGKWVFALQEFGGHLPDIGGRRGFLFIFIAQDVDDD